MYLARWDAEKNTDTLFQNHSIQEIREIEQKTQCGCFMYVFFCLMPTACARNDIQLKKEELRQMVG